MQGIPRKIVQAVLYEAGALVFVAPALSVLFGQGIGHSTVLSVALSAVALAWNMVFNHLFEALERRRGWRERTPLRRLLHAVGFEGGLVVMLTPIMAYGLGVTLAVAFLADLGLFAFFFVYAYGFQWVFDKLFGLPVQPASGCTAHATLD
ncbi:MULTISPECIES: PACE efflux transporter [Pseudomonas]|uniref:PACE efflux transporter n=1 Tax=Pseudomonas quercus TaxID=2722792 RepID=A0ABX0Y8K0_9PSED|nr:MULTISPECIES: PACE efflux transporter [Pseudomonas]MBF7141105.1 PACE efflux transporter [Pseudomonas sp. LY10J]NJO99639.1 PACE efflux transporter [Pseudomonas quercus]